MEIFDISVPIRTGMVTYPGDPQVRLERVASIADGAACEHQQARPRRPLRDARRRARCISSRAGREPRSYRWTCSSGPASSSRPPGCPAAIVAAAPEGAERVLFKTPNSELWAQNEFPEEFAHLDGEGGAAPGRSRRQARRRRLALGRRRGGAPRPPRSGRRPDRGPRPARGRAGRLLPRRAPLKIEGSDGAPGPCPARSRPPEADWKPGSQAAGIRTLQQAVAKSRKERALCASPGPVARDLL